MNKKGFTLVELLAVIVILGILLSLVIISVGKIISNSQKDLSNQQKRNIEEAAKAYNIDRGDLDSTKSCVDVSTLINLGYLEGNKVIDPATKKEMTGSVKITYASNQYSYKYQEKDCRPCEIVSGNKNTIGSEVACEGENFYITSVDRANNTITMLTKWFIETKTDNPKQTEDYASNTSVFSSSQYWVSSSNTNLDYSSYPYVYNTSSTVYQYVEAYKNYLISLGLNISEARLISYKEIVDVCGTSSCSSKPWMKSPLPEGFSYTDYWIGSLTSPSSSSVWRVCYDGIRDNNNYYSRYNGSANGVRPVVVISSSDI